MPHPRMPLDPQPFDPEPPTERLLPPDEVFFKSLEARLLAAIRDFNGDPVTRLCYLGDDEVKMVKAHVNNILASHNIEWAATLNIEQWCAVAGPFMFTMIPVRLPTYLHIHVA